MNKVGFPSLQPPVADVVRVGEGKYLLRPRAGQALEASTFAQMRLNPDGALFVSLLPEWVSALEAARILGVSKASVLRLLVISDLNGNPLIEHHRPTECRILISLPSLRKFEERIRDPKFWEKFRTAKARQKKRVQKSSSSTRQKLPRVPSKTALIKA